MDFRVKLKNEITKKLPFVAYKWPDETKFNLLIQKNDSLFVTKNLSQKGFVFAPFDTNKKTILIPFDQADLYSYPLSDYKIIVNIKNQKKTIEQKVSLNQSEYLSIIDEAIKQIKNKEFDKVVLSRKIDFEIDTLNLDNLIIDLMNNYGKAFTYLWYHPKVGIWAGATPEKLLELKNQSFTTMALAGTQIFKEKANIVWGLKEQEEQQWVTKFITKKLKNNNIPFTLSKPFSLKAGHLAHICTEISGILPQKISLQKFVSSLHPTPAVAGMPRQNAIKFIKENEAYQREFYTGFLGEINNKSRLFVNLRCMQIKPNKVQIYVGVGITADSISLNEWQETEAKSKTLSRLLFY